MATLISTVWLSVHPPHGGSEPKVPESGFPVNLVSASDSKRLREILEDFSIFRQDVIRFESAPKVYRYLLDRIPLSATLIRLLKFGKYRITESTEGQLLMDNQEGLTMKVWIFHKDEKQLVALAEGAYHSWWTTGIRGRGAIWIQFRPRLIKSGPVMENNFVGYIKFRNPVVEIVAKVADFFLRRMTDREIGRGQSAGRLLAELLAKEPAKGYEAMQKSPEVTPRQVEEFRDYFLRSLVSAEP